MLTSFGAPVAAAVFGAAGGIGSAFVEALAADPGVGQLVAASRRKPEALPAGVEWHAFDLADEDSIAAIARAVRPSLVIVATGLLHAGGYGPEKTMAALDANKLMRAFAINSIGPALIAKHMLAVMPRNDRAVFAALSARVGSIADNRLGGWYGYRASKAALNQIIRTLASEWTRRNAASVCVTLHPGTVDTSLSQPFQSGVPHAGLFTPAFAAHALLGVVDGLQAADSGGFFAWNGTSIPY